MGTEHLSGTRLWTLAALCLVFYGIVAFMAFRSWQARHEAQAIITAVETYKQTRGQLPDCEDDSRFDECTRLGLERDHAFYEKKSNTRYLVDYFGFLGMTVYDSSKRAWTTAYWWNGKFAEALR